jgi:predicted nucleic acid-binding Zn ribbon protein
MMKHCPTCRRAFDDDTLTVCPDDGSALMRGAAAAASQSDSGLGGKATWNPSQDQLAEIQKTVTAITKAERKRWPWVVVAIVVVLILIGVVGAIVVSRL